MPKITAQQDAVAAAMPPLKGRAKRRPTKRLPGAAEVFKFWFLEHTQKDWFGFNPKFDAEVARKYGGAVEAALRGELVDWRRSPRGRLIEIVLLDQFTRQIYRGSATAFAGDAMALVLAQEAVMRGEDRRVPAQWRFFFYMPFMHSESLAIHEKYMRCFKATRVADFIDFELAHRDVLARFGRYPFRNAALGRESTPDELAYLEKRGKAIF